MQASKHRLAAAALWLAQATLLGAAELKPETLQAWTAYARTTESRIAGELAAGDRFLGLDFQGPGAAAAERTALRAGKIPVARLEAHDCNGSKLSVPAGMIHHWRGAVLIPGLDLAFVLARVSNPVSEEMEQEDVLQSKILERGTEYLRLYLKLRRSKLVSVVYNTEHEIRYRHQVEARAWSSSKAVRIRELENPGSPGERERPEGRDRGFLWRLNSYWRYQQVDGGVIVECESISLSRSVPPVLEPLVRPLVDMVARESMERTLLSLRGRLLRRYNGRKVESTRSFTKEGS